MHGELDDENGEEERQWNDGAGREDEEDAEEDVGLREECWIAIRYHRIGPAHDLIVNAAIMKYELMTIIQFLTVTLRRGYRPPPLIIVMWDIYNSSRRREFGTSILIFHHVHTTSLSRAHFWQYFCFAFPPWSKPLCPRWFWLLYFISWMWAKRNEGGRRSRAT